MAGILETSIPKLLIILVVIELINEESVAARSILFISALSFELAILVAIKLFLKPSMLPVSIEVSRFTNVLGLVEIIQLRGTWLANSLLIFIIKTFNLN
jgi:hypothetical protein